MKFQRDKNHMHCGMKKYIYNGTNPNGIYKSKVNVIALVR